MAGHFLLQAIVQGKARGDKIATNPVEVQLLVNGVELPFRATLDNLWGRMEADIEERARAMAERMVAEAGLAGVADALHDVECSVREALARVVIRSHLMRPKQVTWYLAPGFSSADAMRAFRANGAHALAMYDEIRAKPKKGWKRAVIDVSIDCAARGALR
jgi:hypothetical protein